MRYSIRPAAAGLLLALEASSGRAFAASFTKGPYLQALGTDRVTVKVELSSAGPVTVEVVPAGSSPAADAGAHPGSRSDKEASLFHAVTVDGLSPSTAYDYRVTAGDARAEVGHFTTAPAPADARPFRFIVYGDSRSDHVTHAAVIRAIEAVPSDFLVNTGDLVAVGDDAEDWQRFFDVEGKLLRDRCVFAAVGNHELRMNVEAGPVPFQRYFGPDPAGPASGSHLYGSFRWSNTRFFLLNAMDAWTGAERDWLRGELERAQDEPGLQHRIAVLHHGPFSSGPHGGNTKLLAAGVADLMRDHKVDLVLAGHDHEYERGEGGGLKYIVSGGAGAPLYPREKKDPATRTFESVHHFVEMSVDGESVKEVARRASGSVIETCGFRGTSGWDCDTAPPATSAAPKAAESNAPAAPRSASSGCGCEMPGRVGGGLGALGLAMAAALAGWRRRAPAG